jgi:predicted DNA-binding transcriptional regulator AlpA
MDRTAMSSQLRLSGPPEPLVSVAQLAEHYGWAKSWIYKQTQAQGIPFYKVGHYCMFRVSEIEEWLQGRRVEPARG